MKIVVKARTGSSSRDERYLHFPQHLCAQLMCGRNGPQKERYAFPVINILWRPPDAWLLAVSCRRHFSTEYIFLPEVTCTAKKKTGRGVRAWGMWGMSSCLSVYKMLLYLGLLSTGEWTEAHGLHFSFSCSFEEQFRILCLFVLTAEVLRLCGVKLNARLRMSLQNN